jgi:hypothetical protein
MIDAVLSAIAASSPAEALRGAQLAYPLVNAAHIVGLATLFGAIAALDLRLLGLFRAVPVEPLARVLPPVAATGLAFAVVTGLLLFSVEPHDYAANRTFLVKLGIIALGVVHAGYVHLTPGWKVLANGGAVTPRLRVSAALSLLIWTGAIVAGRLIAF